MAKEINQASGLQPRLRELLNLIAFLDKETPRHADNPTVTENVDSNDYTITAPIGPDYNDYTFTLTSSEEADEEVEIEETVEQEYTIEAGDNAEDTHVEAALEEYFGGDWAVTADNSQTGSDFDGEELTLEGGQYATEASEGEVKFDDDNLYIAAKNIGKEDESGWREISHSALS